MFLLFMLTDSRRYVLTDDMSENIRMQSAHITFEHGQR